MRSHGIERAVLIQPVPYQTDNEAILDAIGRGRRSAQRHRCADRRRESRATCEIESNGDLRPAIQ